MKQLPYNVIIKCPSFFKIIFILSLAILLTNSKVIAQDKPVVIKKPNVLNELDVIHSSGAGGKDNIWIEFSDAPNSLYHYISGQAYPLLDKRARCCSRFTLIG